MSVGTELAKRDASSDTSNGTGEGRKKLRRVKRPKRESKARRSAAVVTALAAKAWELFDDGRGLLDPNCEELGDACYKGSPVPVDDEIYGMVRNKVRKIRDELQSMQDKYAVHLVSEYYYNYYRGRALPDDPSELMKCLPIGSTKKATGMRFVIDAKDALYVEHLMLRGRQATGKSKVVLEAINEEIATERLSREEAFAIVASYVQRVGKDERHLYQDVLEEIDAKGAQGVIEALEASDVQEGD